MAAHRAPSRRLLLPLSLVLSALLLPVSASYGSPPPGVHVRGGHARRLADPYAIAKDVGGCTFSSNFCNWVLGASVGGSGNKNVWTRGTSTPSGSTGPRTSGNYFLFYEASDSSASSTSPYYADFSSPPLTITSEACKVRCAVGCVRLGGKEKCCVDSCWACVVSAHAGGRDKERLGVCLYMCS